MKRFFGRKTAQILFVVALFCVCVFFACACSSPVTLDLSLDGDIFPDSLLGVELEIGGSDSAVKIYSESEYSLTISDGAAIASIEKGRVRISESAKAGDKFTVRVTVRDLSAEKQFTVAGSAVQSLTLSVAESAEAGDSLPLSAEVYPIGASSGTPTFLVVSGEATVEGNILKISDRADLGEVVVKATLEGVSSEEKRIAITTVQTRELYLTLSANRVLPSGTVQIIARKIPEESSYPMTFSLEKGGDVADISGNVLIVKADAKLGSEIVLVARAGYCEEKATLVVDYPEAQSISVIGEGTVAPGGSRTFDFTLTPSDARKESVKISLVEGEDLIKEWDGGRAFTVKESAPAGSEIVFSLDAGEEAFATVSYIVEEKILSSIHIETAGSLSYLRSGDSLVFEHTTDPISYEGEIHYRVVEGAELVAVNGNVVTVKDDADIGRVRVIATGADGTESNEIAFTVSGRYVRRVYTTWESVKFSSEGETSRLWIVLPSVKNAACQTVLVPSEVVDLVIEGRYDGGEDSAYRDLYFYFRNAKERKVTLWNFATIASQGLGGTVLDFGSSGRTEITLRGDNLIKADSPYLLDNSGEIVNGIWNTGYSQKSLELLRRSGKNGYCGTTGGTAVSGYILSFLGDGTLTAVAGSGVDGTSGGKGANAEYATDGVIYLSGAGGDGGHGGDSGAAIHAYSVHFASGMVTAVAGNAGVGGKGGAAGDLSGLAGRDVNKTAGEAGKDGVNGIPHPAILANTITGSGYEESMGKVESLSLRYEGTLSALTSKLSRFYGVSVLYGSSLYNPYKNYAKARRYTMEQQNDETELMRQMNFLMYTLSRVPRNAWREVEYRSEKQLTIYLCKTITSGTGGTIYGLTSNTNRVWFATFETEIRGVYYGGYFNIMLHEFVHVFHYNFSTAARTSFETSLKSLNYGLSYKTSTTNANERVYGVTDKYDETNSCFLSAYSRKTVLEDAAETLSITATFLTLEPPLKSGTNIRKKYDLLSEAFSRDYETLAAFHTGTGLFAYAHLFD